MSYFKYYGALHNIKPAALKAISNKDPNYEIITQLADHGSIELFSNKKEAKEILTQLRSEIKEFLEPFKEEIQYRYSLTIPEFVSDRVQFIIKEYTIEGVGENIPFTTELLAHLNTRRQKIEEEVGAKEIAVDFEADIQMFISNPLTFANGKVYG